MSRTVRKRLLETINLMKQVAQTITDMAQVQKYEEFIDLLSDYQDLAIAFGTRIEKLRGMNTKTVDSLEILCEQIYQVGETISSQEATAQVAEQSLMLSEKMDDVELAFLEEFPDKKEIVFFPYKASMWDSLESIWEAAKEDKDCEVYVVAIPFYEKNPDGSIKENHYEGDLFPGYVPITPYQEYDMELRKPDIAYIHNPYDEYNTVTSVNPTYYSYNIKKHVATLVYVPYYATAGGMADAQALCSAYLHADYIVTQSEKYKGFFDKRIPEEKFLPFGSPKFDKVIQLCANPPEAPEDWKEKMKGKTVYFYNTSLTGMLDNTPVFLKKMEYVFDTFKGREDACLLWRPHPLLESTFTSMREKYLPEFYRLKERFFAEKLGIYDETPSIENTIALSDVYIGDAGTSVTSLFGVAGKPLFILNNYIDQLPTEQDKKDSIISWPQFDLYENEKYQITSDNKLWVSEKNDHYYRYYMDLGCKYSGGSYYSRAIEFGDEIVVLPQNAQDILIIRDKKIVERIVLKDSITQSGAFNGYYYNKDYIFIFPFRYPHLIRYNIKTHAVNYVEGVGEFRTAYVDGEWHLGGATFLEKEVIIASPTEKRFWFIHMDTLKVRQVELQTRSNCGTQGITPYGDELWMMPLNGTSLVCYNIKEESVVEYDELPEGFLCKHFPEDYVCGERPFGMMAMYKEEDSEKLVLAPNWGNMFVELDRQIGKMQEWKPKKELLYRGQDCYHVSATVGGMAYHYPPRMDGKYRFWYAPERKLLEMDIVTGECKELSWDFSLEDKVSLVAGFSEDSEWLQYGCIENAYNSLKDLLDGRITGQTFDKKRALAAFGQINASTNGDCGSRVHTFVKEAK